MCPILSAGQSYPTSTPSSSALSTNTTQESGTYYQAVRANGIPVCLFCSGPVEFADRLECSDWDKRFCSHDCKKEYQVSISVADLQRASVESEATFS